MRVIGGDPSRPGLAAPTSQRRRVGRESERAIRPWRPGNAGGGTGPCFWCALDEAEDRGLAADWHTPEHADASEEAFPCSEDGRLFGVVGPFAIARCFGSAHQLRVAVVCRGV